MVHSFWVQLAVAIPLVAGVAASGAAGQIVPTAPPQVIPLWEGAAPGAQGTADIDRPTLTVFEPPAGKSNGAAVIVCPGGGYGGLADYEGRPVAKWFSTLGVTGFVLKYRLGPRYHHPIELNDAARALRLVRSRAADWKLDTHRIGILGFSAGGHLASTLETHYDNGDPFATDPVDRVSSRPDVGMLIYPVITLTDPYGHVGSRNNLLGPHPTQDLIDLLSNEKQVTAQTPPTFLVASAADRVVPCENSMLFAMALHKVGVPFELHIYEKGDHGFGMGGTDPVLSTWPERCRQWLQGRGFFVAPNTAAGSAP